MLLTLKAAAGSCEGSVKQPQTDAQERQVGSESGRCQRGEKTVKRMKRVIMVKRAKFCRTREGAPARIYLSKGSCLGI